MPKRALIADPDSDEARKQAAILSDAGYDVRTFGGSDVFEALSSEVPDILFLRHERSGQGGLAWVTRIRRQARFPGVSIIVTTSDLMPESIHEHQRQAFHADAYVRLPVGRRELLDAALIVPELLEPEDESLDDPPAPPALDVPNAQAPPIPVKPPPLSRQSFSKVPLTKTKDASLSASELKFVEDVFDSIREVDALTPPRQSKTPTGPGPDRKLALLRQSLREYEYKLGRLKMLWQTREAQLRESQSIIEKERMSVDGLRLRIAEVEEELLSSQKAMAKREQELGEAMTEQYDDAALREAEALQQVAAQQYKAHRITTQLSALKREHDDMQRSLTDKILNWERAYKELEQFHWTFADASGDELARVDAQLIARDQARIQRRQAHEQTRATMQLYRKRYGEKAREGAQETHALQSRLDRLLVEKDVDLRLEKRARLASQAALAFLEEKTQSLEESLFRHDRTLKKHHRKMLRAKTKIAHLEQRARAEIRDLNARLHDEQTRAKQREQAFVAYVNDAEEWLARSEAESLRARAFAQANIDHFSARTALAETNLKELRERFNDTESRLHVEEREHSEQRALAESLAERLSESERRFQEDDQRLRVALEGEQEEKTALVNMLAEANQKLSILEHKHETLSENFEEQREDYAANTDRHEVERKRFKSDIARLEREIEINLQDAERFKEMIKNRDQRISEHLESARKSDESVLSLESQNKRLYSQIAQYTAGEKAHSEREEELQTQLRQRDAHLRELQKESARLKDEAAARARERDEAKSALDNQTRLLQAERDENEKHAASAKDQVLQVAAQNEKVAELERLLDEARAELQINATLMEDMQTQVDEAESKDHAGAAQTLVQLRKELGVKNEEVQTLQKEREAYEAERALLKKVQGGKGVSDEMRALQKELSEREVHFARSLEKQREIVQKLRIELAERPVTENDETLRGDLLQAREDLKRLVLASSAERESAEVRIALLEKRLGRLNEANQRMKEELAAR